MKFLSFAAVCLLATVAQAAPTKNSDEEPILLTFDITLPPFTPEIFVNWTNGFLNEAGSYLPSELVTELRDMVRPENRAEVQDLTKFITKFLNGKIKMPKKPKACLKVIKKNIPKTYARIEKIQKAFDDKYESLSQQAKDFLTDFENSADNVEVPNNDNATAINFVHFIVNENNKFNNLPVNVRNEFNQKYPETIRALNAPNVKSFINKLIEVNNKSETEILKGLGEAIALLFGINISALQQLQLN